jgi:hypothetical protein
VSKRDAYAGQRENARRRGIPFLLTREEWWQKWRDAGKYHLRGRSKGQFCRARFDDCGAYEVGNVSIILGTENAAQIRYSKRERLRRSQVMLGNDYKLGKKESPETRRRKSEAHMSVRPNATTRKRLSAAQRKRWREHRENTL